MTTTTIDTAALRALAVNASSYEWRYIDYGQLVVGAGDTRVCTIHLKHADGDYIAAADPATVLTLLDRSDRLDAIREAVDTGRWDEVARIAREGE